MWDLDTIHRMNLEAYEAEMKEKVKILKGYEIRLIEDGREVIVPRVVAHEGVNGKGVLNSVNAKIN